MPEPDVTAEARRRIEAYLEAAFPGHDALPYVRGQYWTVALRSRDPGRNHVLEVSEEFLTSHPPDEIVALLDAWRLVEEFRGGVRRMRIVGDRPRVVQRY